MGKPIEITTKRNSGNYIVIVPNDCGDTIVEAVGLFGEAAIYQNYRQSCVIDFQSLRRRHMYKKVEIEAVSVSSDELAQKQEVIDSKPSLTKQTGKSPKDKAFAFLKSMPESERQNRLEDLEGTDEEIDEHSMISNAGGHHARQDF